jgi:hypothetical protein
MKSRCLWKISLKAAHSMLDRLWKPPIATGREGAFLLDRDAVPPRRVQFRCSAARAT